MDAARLVMTSRATRCCRMRQGFVVRDDTLSRATTYRRAEIVCIAKGNHWRFCRHDQNRDVTVDARHHTKAGVFTASHRRSCGALWFHSSALAQTGCRGSSPRRASAIRSQRTLDLRRCRAAQVLHIAQT